MHIADNNADGSETYYDIVSNTLFRKEKLKLGNTIEHTSMKIIRAICKHNFQHQCRLQGIGDFSYHHLETKFVVPE